MSELKVEKTDNGYRLSVNGGFVFVTPKDVDTLTKMVRYDRKIEDVKEKIIKQLEKVENNELRPRDFQRNCNATLAQILDAMKILEKEGRAYVRYVNSKGVGRPWKTIVLGKK